MPEPGGPVIPTRCALPATGYRRRSAASASRRPVLDCRQEPGQRPPVAGHRRFGQLRRPARNLGGLPHPSRAAVRWPAGIRRRRRWSCPARTPRRRPASRRGWMSSSGMIPPTVTSTSSRPDSGQQLRDARHERHVRARQDRQADHVDVLLERGRGDHLGRLAKAGVDDFEALVAQPAREHLGAAVVAVQSGLGDEHLERSIGHARIVDAAGPRQTSLASTNVGPDPRRGPGRRARPAQCSIASGVRPREGA